MEKQQEQKQQQQAARFRALHESGVFVIPNVCDGASAAIMARLGFEALATSSAACAATLGKLDGEVTREEALLHALAGDGRELIAVGDPDQSIYAFRGANVGNMRDFEQEFKVRNLIKLEQNYRSHGHILDAANHLIANNSRRLGKNLRTNAGHGEPVRVYEAATDSQEAGWIVEEIRALISTGASRSEIAVLYRSNAQSRTIEHTLVNVGIPYRVYGGLRFFERQEVKHALAYLRLIDNPNDDTAFARVVNFPTRGIGARSDRHKRRRKAAAGP